MITDDVYLIKLTEDTRYLTKRTIADNKMKDRILLALDNYERIVHADVSLAYDMAQDLNIIRSLIKIESEHLDRKLSIFERKLNEIGDIILPKDEDHEDVFHVKQPMTTTIFQDSDIRIIDIKNKKSALAKMQQAKQLAAAVKQVIELCKVHTLPLIQKCDIHTRMNQILDLLKLDGGLALQLQNDVKDINDAFNEDEERESVLDFKLKIMTLKLEKCFKEVQVTQPVIEQFPRLY